jgi:hypothetical protein
MLLLTTGKGFLFQLITVARILSGHFDINTVIVRTSKVKNQFNHRIAESSAKKVPGFTQ